MPRPRLTVDEASVAYIRAMRNVLPADTECVCRVCRTFIAPQYETCLPCDRQPNHLDTVVPITYSEHLGQMHTALRSYKDGPEEGRRYATVRLTAILWRFLSAHEECVAWAAGVPGSPPRRDSSVKHA